MKNDLLVYSLLGVPFLLFVLFCNAVATHDDYVKPWVFTNPNGVQEDNHESRT